MVFRCTELILPERVLVGFKNKTIAITTVTTKSPLQSETNYRSRRQLFSYLGRVNSCNGPGSCSRQQTRRVPLLLNREHRRWLSRFQEGGGPAFSKVDALVCFSFAVMNTVAGSHSGSKEYVWLTGCSSSREAGARTQSRKDLEAGTGTDTVAE